MIEYTIFCDACGDMIDSDSRSARQARKRAKAKGLLVRILRKDYCPKCAEKIRNEEEIDGSLTVNFFYSRQIIFLPFRCKILN